MARRLKWFRRRRTSGRQRAVNRLNEGEDDRFLAGRVATAANGTGETESAPENGQPGKGRQAAVAVVAWAAVGYDEKGCGCGWPAWVITAAFRWKTLKPTASGSRSSPFTIVIRSSSPDEDLAHQSNEALSIELCRRPPLSVGLVTDNFSFRGDSPRSGPRLLRFDGR